MANCLVRYGSVSVTTERRRMGPMVVCPRLQVCKMRHADRDGPAVDRIKSGKIWKERKALGGSRSGVLRYANMSAALADVWKNDSVSR